MNFFVILFQLADCFSSFRLKLQWKRSDSIKLDTVQRETFEGENFRGSIGSENFAEKTFTDCVKQIIGGCGTPPNFAEKTFTDGSQTLKSAKVFSLESFPLYGRQ